MISQFLKPVNFILLYEAGFDPWACLLYSALSFLCEEIFFFFAFVAQMSEELPPTICPLILVKPHGA